MTLAVDEQKMKFGGEGEEDASAKLMRLCRPAMWSFVKLERRMLKFTAQAAWMMMVVRLARSL